MFPLGFVYGLGFGLGGLEWGSSVAARYRVVRCERTPGSIVICGTRRASIVARPQRAPVNVTCYRRSCGYGPPVRRVAPRRWPAQPLRPVRPDAHLHGCTGCQPGSPANSDILCRRLRRELRAVTCTAPARQISVTHMPLIGSRHLTPLPTERNMSTSDMHGDGAMPRPCASPISSAPANMGRADGRRRARHRHRHARDELRWQQHASDGVGGRPRRHLRLEAIAVTTLVGDTTKQPVEDILYVGFVQAAVYNAVVGVEGRYAPYRVPRPRAARGLGPAAAVAAAHQVLVTYVAVRPGGPWTPTMRRRWRSNPRQQGEDPRASRSAHRRRRQPDPAARPRRPQCPHLFHPAPGARGMAAHPARVAADVGAMARLRHAAAAAQRHPVRPARAAARSSPRQRYTRDFAEVKALGSADSTARTAEQTATALFFSGNALVQYDIALRDQVAVRHLDIVDAAHLFAAVTMTQADTIISVWRAKYTYGFWRADHRDQPGGHRRQPGNRRRPRLDPAAPPPAVPGLRAAATPESPVRSADHSRARSEPGTCRSASPPRRVPGAAPDLRFGSRPQPGRHRRTSVARHPLPNRRHRWHAHGHPGRRLDSRPLLPAGPGEGVADPATGHADRPCSVITW